MTNNKPFNVLPTGGKNGDQYSDIALGNLFNAHISFINVEKQLAWQRYFSLLVANSIIFGFLAQFQLKPIIVVIGACIVGLLLCVAWLIITKCGWDIMNKRLRYAKLFEWEGCENPANIHFASLKAAGGKEIDWIYLISRLIIGVFAIAYIGIVILSFYN